MTRTHGRAPRGQRLIGRVPHGRWTTMTFLAGLRVQGIIAPCVIDGPINGLTFLAWVTQFLVPALRPGDIVVLDNLGSHTSLAVRRAIRDAGAHRLLLPPYSPDLNPLESNSHTLVYLMKKTAMGVNMTVVEAPARTASAVPAAAQGLVGKADVIFVLTDNTIVAKLDAVIKVGVDNGMPVYTGDIDAVKRGAIAPIGLNYYNVGWQAGNMVVRILGGAQPGKIPVAVADKTKLYVNPTIAGEMGLTIPEDVVSQADEVVK